MYSTILKASHILATRERHQIYLDRYEVLFRCSEMIYSYSNKHFIAYSMIREKNSNSYIVQIDVFSHVIHCIILYRIFLGHFPLKWETKVRVL